MERIRELLSKLIQRGHGWLDSWNGLHRKKNASGLRLSKYL